MYIWQFPEFPHFTFQTEELQLMVQRFTLGLGEANGMLHTFSAETKQEIFAELMLSEALKTSEIEGAYFSHLDNVRSPL